MIASSVAAFLTFAGLSAALPALTQTSLANCTEYSSVPAGKLCLDRPSDCSENYLVAPGDTCGSIASRLGGISTSALYYFNPDIGTDCLGLRAYAPLCINTPWYKFTEPAQQPIGTVWSMAGRERIELPIPLAPGVSDTCSTYKLAGGSLHTAGTLLEGQNTTISRFLELNPKAHSEATPYYLWAGYWYALEC